MTFRIQLGFKWIQHTVILIIKPKYDQILMKILFLSANPKDTKPLDLIGECNMIEDKVKSTRFANEFEFKQRHETSLARLQGYLLEFNPQIVHFSGHGTEQGTLVFQDVQGSGEEATIRAVANLFKTLNDRNIPEDEKIKVVVLNACFSKPQAEAISRYVDFVVGMKNAVYDDAAKVFAESFYQAIGYGESVRTALELGKNQVELLSIPGQDLPKLEVKKMADPSKPLLNGRARSVSSKQAEEALIALSKIFEKVDSIGVQTRQVDAGLTRGSQRGGPPEGKADKPGKVLYITQIRRGVIEAITAEQLAQRLSPQDLQLIKTLEASMDNRYKIWSAVYPKFSIEVNPIAKSQLELQLDDTLKQMCSEYQHILGFIKKCGYRLNDHYNHVDYICKNKMSF